MSGCGCHNDLDETGIGTLRFCVDHDRVLYTHRRLNGRGDKYRNCHTRENCHQLAVAKRTRSIGLSQAVILGLKSCMGCRNDYVDQTLQRHRIR